MKTTKGLQDELIKKMKEWQQVESAAIEITREIGEKTDNPLIRTAMGVINTDSARHKNVQQLITESLEKSHLIMNIEDMLDIWNLIERHIELEREMVHSVGEVLEALQGKKDLVIQRYLLEYLQEDEKKHEKMLKKLNDLKNRMYP